MKDEFRILNVEYNKKADRGQGREQQKCTIENKKLKTDYCKLKTDYCKLKTLLNPEP